MSLGLKWQCAGIVKPTTGRQLTNLALAEDLSIKLEFTREEWDAFGITNLHIDDYIKSELGFVCSYFKPLLHEMATHVWVDTIQKAQKAYAVRVCVQNFVCNQQVR